MPGRRKLIKSLLPILTMGVGVGLLALMVEHSSTPSWREQVLAISPKEVEHVVAVLKQMPDPVERGVAAELWVRQNRGHVDPVQGVKVCRTLDQGASRLCERRLYAAHLQR
jgi:hypothetical protein